MQRTQAMASILACGVDPNVACVYHQSQVPEITKLQWILSCFTSMGQLNRMTQFKSKSSIHSPMGEAGLGLFSYPVLMAADILSVRATHVPVGQDQGQHLELTRDIVQRFNKAVGNEYFEEPVTVYTPTKRIASLKQPQKKMSKSDPNALGKIFINEDPEAIRKKFNKATTDSIEGISLDWEGRPGISNLITILAACQNQEVLEVAATVADWSKQQLKEAVAEVVIKELDEPKRRYNEYMANLDEVERIANEGKERARARASETVAEVSRLVGMGY